MGDKRVIGIYGVFAVGKSFLAHGLSLRLWDYDTVATDNILAIARDVDNKNLYLQQSSYLAWRVLGKKTLENIIEGFRKYRESLQPFIRIILDRAYKQRVDMIIEGIHISPDVFQEYEGLLDTRPILITVKDKNIHWERIKQKCLDRPALLKRFAPYFDIARDLQDFLIEEAEIYGIPIIDNSRNKGHTLEKIWLNLIKC